MKKSNLVQTVTLLANIGVIASLIFVGIQIHQSTKATRSATVLQLKNSWVELNLAEATSVDLAKAFQAVDTGGWENASYVDKSLASAFFRTLFHNWSNAYYQYRNGTLDEEQWMPHLREAESTLQNRPLARQVWTAWNYVYDDSFRKLMDGFVASSGKASQ